MKPAWLSRRAVCAGLSVLAAPCLAQAWPSRLVKIIVPFTPGGSTDLLARILADKLAPALGQAIIVENRPGAGGSIGATAVARAEPDGHTLLMGHIGTLAFNPSLYADLAYDPLRDFAPVAHAATVPNILVVNPNVAATSVREFIALAKANPDKLAYGSGGNGSAAHIATAYFASRGGFNATHVPYRGTAPAVADLLSGQTQFMLTGGPALLPHVAVGKLRALGVSSLTPAPFAPGLATIADVALPGFEAVQWYGIVAPKRTPEAVVRRLNTEINRLLDAPALAGFMEKDGAIAGPMSTEAFGAKMAAEILLWRDVIKRAGITAS